jgi:hypothetical protein
VSCLTNKNNKCVEHAIGQFYDTVLTTELGKDFGIVDCQMSVGSEYELYKIIVALLQTECKYIYSPPNLDSALRIFFCFFNTTWFGMYYLDSDYAECQVRWRENWKKKRHFQAAPRDHGKCVAKNTEVIVQGMKRKKIQDINVGDIVLSYDTEEDGNYLVYSVVIAKTFNGKQSLYRLKTEGEKQVYATAWHKFLCKSDLDSDVSWQELQNIKVGQYVLVFDTDTYDYVYDRVVENKYIYNGKTFDLQVSGTHSYIANDIVSHNSHIYSYESPLWHICYVDNVRILAASKSENLAEKYLGAIKRTIETNEKILRDFGDLTENINPVDGRKLEGGKGTGGWAKNQLFCRRTNHSLKDGTVESIGWGSSITGSRFDLIILDDPIEESDCRTERGRKKQIETLHVLEELLEPDGKFHVIGTRKHYSDLYSYIIDNPRWSYTIDRAIIKYPERYDYVYVTDEVTGKEIAVDVIIPEGVDYEVLWPEKWSIKDLLLKKHGSLPMHFARDIQNEVISDESSVFPEDVISNCRDIVILGNRQPFCHARPDWARWVVCGIDLAGIFSKKVAEERDSDYFVITVLAIPDNSYDRHLIYAYRTRGIDADEQLSKIIEINENFKPDVIVLEVNAYQKAMEGLALKARLPIFPHNTGSEKWDLEAGLPRLSIELKNQYFVLYTGIGEAEQYYDVLFSELNGFSSEKHDDTVMSLWLANLGANWLIDKDRKKKQRKIMHDHRAVSERVKKELEYGDVTVQNTKQDITEKDREEALRMLEERIKKYQ